MKKLFYFALCVILIFSLTACNKEDKKELTLDDQIKQAYLNKTGEQAPLEEISVQYVYNFEDAYAVFMDCSLWVYGEAITNIQVGDNRFTFPTTQEMLIYKGGACYKLTEAYDQKLLTEAQWQMLFNTWTGANPHLYVDVFDNDDLLAIISEAKELLVGQKYTIENPSSYVQFFFRSNDQLLASCVETQENDIVLSASGATSKQQAVLEFGAFLHLVCSRYPDAVCSADYSYTADTNRPYFPYMFFFPDYKAAGYETALDACKAIAETSGKTEDNAFYIHMTDHYEILEWFMSGATAYKAWEQ